MPADTQALLVAVVAPVCGLAEASGPPNPVPKGLEPVQTKKKGSTGLPQRSRSIAWTIAPDQSPAGFVVVVTSVPSGKYRGVVVCPQVIDRVY